MAETKVNGSPETAGRPERAAGDQTASSSVFAAPFSAAGSCVLSEDYFLTSQVIMRTGDVVRPFARADGTVEALVLSGGAVLHLSRSAADTSGWKITALDPPTGGPVVDLAVNSGPDGTVWALMLLNLGHDSDAFYWAVLGSSGDWDYPGELSIAMGLDQLRSGLDPDGNVYFYAFFTSSASPLHPNGSFALWQPHSSWLPKWNVSLVGLDIVDARLLWNPGFSASDSAGGVLTLTSTPTIEWHPQTSSADFDPLPNWNDGDASALLWASWSANPLDTDPSYVAQGSNGTVYYTDVQSFPVALTVLPSVGEDKVTTWFNDDLVSFAMLVEGTVNILAQYGDPGINDDQFTVPIPIAQNILSVCGLPTDPRQGTLFVTSAEDSTLSVLTKSPVVDAATGTTADVWISVPVQQPTATMQELDCWRVQLTITDDNGVTMPGTDLAITADQQLWVWQASGNTVLSSASPATMTTDALGRVTFAYPAAELDTVTLSVQVMQGGTPSGNPVIVHPDGDVHAFLAGTGALNDIGTLATSPSGATALVQAKNSVNQPLFPVLAGLSGNDLVTASNGVASTLIQAMAAGQGVQPGINDAKSFLLDMSGTVPRYSSSTSPTGVSLGLESSGWWERAKNDAESVYHGIRHGLIKVEQCAGTWAKDAENAAQWTLNLAITIGQDISDVISIVVTDVRSAIHAVSGIFHTLGADITEGFAWLRAAVSGVFTAADSNAALLQGWLALVPVQLNQMLARYQHITSGYFVSLTDDTNRAISDLINETEGLTFGNPVPAASQAAQLTGSFDPTRFFDVKAQWLFDKLYAWLKSPTSFAPDANISSLLSDLVDAVVTGVEKMVTGMGTLFNDLKAKVAKATDFKDLGIETFFGFMQALVDGVLALADAVVTALFTLVEAVVTAFGTFLGTSIDDVPLIGGLLKAFGVEHTTTVGHLLSLVAMFPVTLVHQIDHQGQPLFPGGAVVGASAGPVADSAGPVADSADWGPSLLWASAGIQAVWGACDLASDTLTATGETTLPQLLVLADIVLPAILQVPQWPGTSRSDGTTAPPLSTPPDFDGSSWMNTMAWMLSWREHGPEPGQLADQ